MSASTLHHAFTFCESILPHVSRTFALTIPLLREPLRARVGVAYLLCRIVDTVEDRAELPESLRNELLRRLPRLARDPERAAAACAAFLSQWEPHPDPHHQSLMLHTPDVLACLASFEESTREAILECVDEMARGMALFPSASAEGRAVDACADLVELETYCHYVAGTVGILLTRLFAAELPAAWAGDERREDGRRFGLGLQLTNVLKDFRGDRTRGVNFIPPAWLDTDAHGTRLNDEGARTMIKRALSHLDAAHHYILSLPSERADMRAFCLLAARLATATLAVIYTGRRETVPTKITRDRVWEINREVQAHAGDDVALARLYQRDRRAVEAVLQG